MIFQSMKMAWHAVVSNKLRSFLTMLGIIIGVVALIVLVSIANGATSSVTDQISSMGSSYLTVTITDDKGNPLRLKELSDFCEPEEVDEVAPVSWTSVTAKTSYSNGTMTLTGTTGSYADIQGLELFSGRFLKQTDIDNNSYVVVITKDTATELLGRVDAVGESIKLNGKSFLVVGVLSDSTSMTQGAAVTSSSDSDDSDSSSSSVQLEGYIPFSTMTRLADNVLDVTMFYASGTDEDSLEPAENALTELLMERFGEDEDAFSIVDQSEIMEANWNHEHHAGICDREDQGDRYPKSHRCRKRNHHAAVSDRGASGKFDGMPCGNRSFLGDPESGSCGDEEFHEFYHGYESGLAVCGIFCPDRCAFWSVSGQQGSIQETDRCAPVFRLIKILPD